MRPSRGPTSAFATAPAPDPQASLMVIVGGLLYPLPGFVISIPKIAPAAFTTGLPAAPDPPPPEKLIDGGPHGTGRTGQSPRGPPSPTIPFNFLPRP